MDFLPSHIEQLPVEKLIGYARNARTHTEHQIGQIASSIKEFGWTTPILIDGENGVIAGHGRLEAAKKLGMVNVPCIRLEHLTDTQKRALVLADNRIALNSGWDSEMLAVELQALADDGFDALQIGFSAEELNGLLAGIETVDEGLTDDDAVPELAAEAVSKRGDVWILGPHRLMVGDSTSIDDVERLCDGQEVDLIWTDPPYNVAYEGGSGMTIQNDDMGDGQFRQFLTDAFVAGFAVAKPGCPIYIAHADSEGINFRLAMKDAGFDQKQTLIWVKQSLVLGRQDYQWKHEPILYGWKPGAAHPWFGYRDKTTVFDDDVDLKKLDKPALIKIINQMQNGSPTTIIREDKPHKNDIHPTMKPVALVELMVDNSSVRGNTVLDLFGGSGSTMIACEKLARRAMLMELDERYADAIVRRWQEFTGKDAKLESTGQNFNEVAANGATEEAEAA